MAEMTGQDAETLNEVQRTPVSNLGHRFSVVAVIVRRLPMSFQSSAWIIFGIGLRPIP
jgi:hypothetical protein